MRPTARGLAYVSALLIAFGGVAPWVTVDGEVGGASPLAVALTFFLAVAVTVAAALQRRDAIRILAPVVAALALVARSNPAQVLLSAEAAETGVVTVTSGLSLIVLGAVGLFAASWLPAPGSAPTAAADAKG